MSEPVLVMAILVGTFAVLGALLWWINGRPGSVSDKVPGRDGPPPAPPATVE